MSEHDAEARRDTLRSVAIGSDHGAYSQKEAPAHAVAAGGLGD